MQKIYVSFHTLLEGHLTNLNRTINKIDNLFRSVQNILLFRINQIQGDADVQFDFRPITDIRLPERGRIPPRILGPRDQ